MIATKSAESGSLIIKEKALLVLARDQVGLLQNQSVFVKLFFFSLHLIRGVIQKMDILFFCMNPLINFFCLYHKLMECCQATEAGVQSELSKLSKKEKNRIFDLRGKVSPFLNMLM